jgi:alpha-mannosidase
MTQHQQPRDAYLSLRRFQTYFRDVIEPAIWVESSPLTAEVHQITDPHAAPITAEQAAACDFRPVAAPWNWGPKWSTAWFRVRGEVPRAWKGKPVALRFSSGTEALLWRLDASSANPATALQGFDVNRDAYHLAESADGGERIEALIEAACNHPFGAGGFEWDPAEVHARWASEHPGRFERCEVAVFDPHAWELRQRYAVALKLLEELPLDSNRAQQLIAALTRATNTHTTGQDLTEPLAALERTLVSAASGSTTRCFAVGHAHLDTAWLWPIRETKRKVLRTFSNQLRNMERFPEYRFLASQTQHYAWVEERDPALFARIKARVEEGRWEAGGGMWIEPDVNCVSGESLIRQMLHADRWWRSRFGDKGKQRFLYLPDTFGFGGNLPQIMRHGGLDTFITNKLHWWQHTTFPYTTFWWCGIDGTSVLAHNTPGQDYNATNTPKELRRGEATHRNKSCVPTGPQDVPRPDDTPGGRPACSEPIWLQPFGFGDGGGGATDWSIRFAELAKDCDGLPRVEFSSATAFCDELHAQHQAEVEFPQWYGELDMEIHRGTLTSQAWIKKANVQAEQGLRLAEMLTTLSDLPGRKVTPESRARFDRAWKLTLLNQFHDILPGSSIGWVYEDAKQDHAEIQRLIGEETKRFVPAPGDSSAPTSVFNPTTWPFRGVIDHRGEPVFVDSAPPLGTGPIVSRPTAEPVSVETRPFGIHVSNGIVAFGVSNVNGEIGFVSLLGGPESDSINAPSLSMYEDRPIMWDAWDVDHFYVDKPISLPKPTSIAIIENHPLRCTIQVEQRVSERSTITRKIVLHAGSPRIDVHFAVEWHEKHMLLRYDGSTNLGPQSTCTHATHFGHLTRPTHRNTAHERARFEFPAQGWMDLSERGRGMAILADSKFGFSCWHDSGMHRWGVSLLRAPTFPDEHADEGHHEFTVSLLRHAGDWRQAGVLHHAELLRSPPVSLAAVPERSPFTPPFHIKSLGPAALQIAAIKRAEDSKDLIVRLHECHGARGLCELHWNVPVADGILVDGLERSEEEGGERDGSEGCYHQGQVTTLDLMPFQLITLRLSLP